MAYDYLTTALKGRRVSGLAIAGFCLSWSAGPIGIILSAVALDEIAHNADTLRGKGLAGWGIFIGLCTTVLGIVLVHNHYF